MAEADPSDPTPSRASRDEPAEDPERTSDPTEWSSPGAPGDARRSESDGGSMRGRTLGRYVVLDELGRGGMGTVLKAYDESLDRAIAIKLLHQEVAERHANRLEREAQALARLKHPNIVVVHEVGEVDGRRFIAMELVEGLTLRKWQKQPRPWQECVKVYLQAGEGLAAAHLAGLVHRDFKPDNVIIDARGCPKVLDFGLVRVAESGVETPSTGGGDLASREDWQTSLTHPGSVMGTPSYMSLEQFMGEPVDARSDQFGFCVSLYEALYGERPFEGIGVASLLLALREQKVRPAPKGRVVPGALRRVLLRGLSADPDQRWPSMEALLGQLRALVAPRSRNWVGLGLAGGMVAIGLGVARYAEVGQRCEGARMQLEGVWDQEHERLVQGAILGTELAYAPATWERTRARLDEYAEAWVAKHRETCEATSVRGEQSAEVMDLRMSCLHERRIALREAVAVLGEADERRVKHAVTLVAGLPELRRCDDVDALRSDLVLPEDPAAAQQVAALREQLHRAKALEGAGAFDEALTVAEAAVEHAQALDHAPSLAEALLQRGRAREREARYADAEQDLEQAFTLAVEHDHHWVAANASALLTWVVGSRLGRPEQGLWWGKTALPLARSPHVEPKAEVVALNHVGSVLSDAGRLEEALTHYQRALTVGSEALGPSAPLVPALLGNIGTTLQRLGRQDEALVYFRRALAIKEDMWGPEHPSVVTTLSNLGGAQFERGELDQALATQRRVLEIFERSLGPRHPKVAIATYNLGITLETLGQLPEALDLYRQALDVFERALGSRHPNIAHVLGSIGDVLREQGQLDRAQAHYDRALTIIGEALEPTHPQAAGPLLGLAEIELERGQSALAREHARNAVSILETGEGAPDALAVARFALARSLWPEAEERARARALAEQARDALAEAGDGSTRQRGEVEAWLAEHHVP